jgi:tyrosine aminotransferase
VYSKEHLLDILEVAERHKLPIIADEVYEFFTFPGVQFYPIAALSKNVPILSELNILYLKNSFNH